MEENGFNGQEKERKGDEVYSKVVRAGKRTYFFDVKATKGNDFYLTITESKKRFNQENGKFFYEKHKIFLYKEDFEKFSEGLNETVEKIDELLQQNGATIQNHSSAKEENGFSDVNFDDLGK